MLTDLFKSKQGVGWGQNVLTHELDSNEASGFPYLEKL
jgi:hypothetical protein